MKLKNTAHYIIYAAGEVILPGSVSEKDIPLTSVIKHLIEKGHLEEVAPSEEKTSTAVPDDPKTSLVKKIKAMRSLDKLKDEAESLGVEVEDADTVESLKAKLVAYYEEQ